jgi:hypothetical protein
MGPEGHRAHKADLSHLDELPEGADDLIESLKAGAWEDLGCDYAKVTMAGLMRRRPDLMKLDEEAWLGAMEEQGIELGGGGDDVDFN